MRPITQSQPVGRADCTVVIPTYNERENIGALIPQVLAASPRLRVLVVDDNSPDGTGELVAELARGEPRVGLLARPGKLGLGTAYVAGFRQALADDAGFILEMDADFSHDPRYLPALPGAAERQYDLVLEALATVWRMRFAPGEMGIAPGPRQIARARI